MLKGWFSLTFQEIIILFIGRIWQISIKHFNNIKESINQIKIKRFYDFTNKPTNSVIRQKKDICQP